MLCKLHHLFTPVFIFRHHQRPAYIVALATIHMILAVPFIARSLLVGDCNAEEEDPPKVWKGVGMLRSNVTIAITSRERHHSLISIAGLGMFVIKTKYRLNP